MTSTDSAVVDIITPGLTLDKVASAPADTNVDLIVGNVGDTITNTFTITNSGDSVIDGPLTIDDDLVGFFNCAPGPLAVSDSVSCTHPYVIMQADLDAGS